MGPDPDGPPPDDPPGQFCIGTLPIRPCFPDGEPTGSITSGGLDTDTQCPLLINLDGRTYCVLAAHDIAFSANARFLGSRPLLLVGVFSITVAMGTTLDLSSSTIIQPRLGAGAQPPECQNSGTGMGNQDGGAGGSFAGKGGDGGQGTDGMAGGVAAGAQLAKFRGGCGGANGGNNNLGGPGGGAVYLISNAVTVSGSIRATGGGGRAGGVSGGGGGGGSGGYIGIDAANVIINGILSATGGGGGGGGCMGDPGTNGADADALGNLFALGGAGADTDPFGDGGFGGGANTEAGSGRMSQGAACAGGGGGGGKGTIQFFQGKTCSGNNCFPSAVSNP